jgi:hypothetical protein
MRKSNVRYLIFVRSSTWSGTVEDTLPQQTLHLCGIEVGVTPFNWTSIVKAIREQNFGEVTLEEWQAVACMLENLAPKKRGRKKKGSEPRPVEEFNSVVGHKAKRWFKYDEDLKLQENTERWVSHFDEFLLEMAHSHGLSIKACSSIRQNYAELRRRGVKAVKAKDVIAKAYRLEEGHKVVDAILTANIVDDSTVTNVREGKDGSEQR